MLGLIPRFSKLDEYENAVLRGEDIKTLILKCELHTPAGFITAEGTGARRVIQDNGDINKSLKMAEKSAHIDATLRMAGLSELFTQDLENMNNGERATLQPNAEKPTPAPENPPAQQERVSPANGGTRITGKQYSFIMGLMKEAGMTKQELNAHCIKAYGSVVDHISRIDASSVIDWFRIR